MFKNIPFYTLIGLLLLSINQCTQPVDKITLQELLTEVEFIKGQTAYLNSPYVTAGDRVYMVGHQDGQFPDLGWHVKGEMGGIWDHPIKLVDGFIASLEDEKGNITCLKQADEFINYPIGNQHIYAAVLPNLDIKRFQFAPDGEEAMVVEYLFENKGTKPIKTNFYLKVFTDLSPVWLGERTNMIDGIDVAVFDEAKKVWVAKDSLNDWFVLFGTTAPVQKKGSAKSCDYTPQGKGTAMTLQLPLEIAAGGTFSLPFTFAGSYQSEAAAQKTYQKVSQQASNLLQAKIQRYVELAENTALTIPDKDLEKAFRWLKYNTDWLIRDVPNQGRGISAGIPDYPWWFGVDSEYALKGVIATGRKDLVYSTIELIHSISEKANGNGRIIHEVSTNGAVFNLGNINETPQFASLIWEVYKWTGDRDFLEKYYPTIQKGLDWLFEANDKDGNLLPDGFGMMEIHGLNSEMIDVAVYTQRAFVDAASMATVLGDEASAKTYTDKASQLKTIINTDFWVSEFDSYADFIGTAEQALHLIDDAIIRADTLNKPWAVAELKETRKQVATYPKEKKQGFVLHHNWVVNTPMEMGIADPEKALAALETGSQFVSPFGVFVTGIDRDETAGKDEGSFAKNKKVFTYTGAVMTLPTGVQAIAENNYGRPDKALEYLERMTRSFSYALPGSIYEVSPDFGMMAQAWNIYSYAVPIVQQFFGIQPMAAEKTVRIQPLMPSSWKQASLMQVKMGNNALDMHYQETNDAVKIVIKQTQKWQIEFAFPQGKYTTCTINGKSVDPLREGGTDIFKSKATSIEIILQ